MEAKREVDDAQEPHAPAQEARILDGVSWPQAQQRFLEMRRHLHPSSIKQPETAQIYGHDDDDDGPEDDEKLQIAQFRLAGDHIVGRISHQCGRSPDIGRDRFHDQKRHRIQLKPVGNGQGDRRHQEHRGDIVEHGRQHGGDDGQQCEHAKGLRPRALRGPDGQDLKEPCAADNIHDDHHADQEKDDVIVDAELLRIERFVLGHHA